MKKKGSILSLFLLFFLTGVLVILLICILYPFENEEQDGDDNREYSYVLSNFYSETNKSSIGFIRISKSLGRNQFISFRSRNKNINIYSTITRISDEEFICSGTCFCDQEINKRRNIYALNSLIFVVSAISLTLAIRISQQYFDDECASKYSPNSCPTSSIFSSVDKCEHLTLEQIRKDVALLERKLRKKNKLLEEEGKKGMSYYCEGFCLPNMALRADETKNAREKFSCQEKTVEARVVIYKKPYRNLHARNKFYLEMLRPFCRYISKYKYNYIYYRLFTTKRGGEREIKRTTVSLCVGNSREGIIIQKIKNCRCYKLPSLNDVELDPKLSRGYFEEEEEEEEEEER